MKERPLIAVIITTWNNRNDITDCLQSLASQTYRNFRTIVVDNDSGDGTRSIVKKHFQWVQLIHSEKNLYYTGGNNLGINYALENYQPEFILILNPDTYSDPDLLEKLLDVISKDEKIGAVGPKVKFWKNKLAGRINSAGLDYDGFSIAYDWGFGEEDQAKFNSEKEVFGVTGTCIMFRTKMLEEIGFFWEKLQMYLDEVELFLRAKKAGWKVVYTPSTSVGHKYMSSTNQNKQIKTDKQKMRNWLYIAWRHYPLEAKLRMSGKFLLFYVRYILSKRG